MKLNFKASHKQNRELSYSANSMKDLKQQKFTIDAEPTDTVRSNS